MLITKSATALLQMDREGGGGGGIRLNSCSFFVHFYKISVTASNIDFEILSFWSNGIRFAKLYFLIYNNG